MWKLESNPVLYYWSVTVAFSFFAQEVTGDAVSSRLYDQLCKKRRKEILSLLTAQLRPVGGLPGLPPKPTTKKGQQRLTKIARITFHRAPFKTNFFFCTPAWYQAPHLATLQLEKFCLRTHRRQIAPLLQPPPPSTLRYIFIRRNLCVMTRHLAYYDVDVDVGGGGRFHSFFFLSFLHNQA